MPIKMLWIEMKNRNIYGESEEIYMKNKKAFTILELLVVVAIIAILAIIAIPQFIGRIQEAKAARESAEAAAVQKAAQMFFVDHGFYPTEDGEQPTSEEPKKIRIITDGGSLGLYPEYLKGLPQSQEYYIDDIGKTYNSDPSAGAIGVKQVCAGGSHTLVLMEDGTVKAWGDREYNKLGYYADAVSNRGGYQIPTTIPGLTGVKQVAAGWDHSVALMNDGTVKAWGSNEYGQLGIPDQVDSLMDPTTIPDLTGVKQIAANGWHTVALMEDGTVKAWGRSDFGQAGIPTFVGTPTDIEGLTGVIQISAGRSHTVALLNDGTVKAWGRNKEGQLGVSDNCGTYAANPIPISIPDLTGVKQVSAGGSHTVAIMSDDTVKAWGHNNYGQLGISENSGLYETSYIPTPTTIPDLADIKQISAGHDYTVAIMNDGTVKSWGSNRIGQLGVLDNCGTYDANTNPISIPDLTGVKQVSAGGTVFFDAHTLALMNDGTVKAWGGNAFGQLGIEDNFDTRVPNPNPTNVILE